MLNAVVSTDCKLSETSAITSEVATCRLTRSRSVGDRSIAMKLLRSRKGNIYTNDRTTEIRESNEDLDAVDLFGKDEFISLTRQICPTNAFIWSLARSST